MVAKNLRVLLIFLGMLVLILGIYLYAPNPWEDRRCLVPERFSPGIVVSRVWPPPNTELGLNCYRAIERGIEIDISALVADIFPPPGDSSGPETILERTSYRIDGLPAFPQEILGLPLALFYTDENGEKVYIDGPGAYRVSLFSFLGRGKHTAVVKTQNNVGDVLEYKWSFTLK